MYILLIRAQIWFSVYEPHKDCYGPTPSYTASHCLAPKSLERESSSIPSHGSYTNVGVLNRRPSPMRNPEEATLNLRISDVSPVGPISELSHHSHNQNMDLEPKIDFDSNPGSEDSQMHDGDYSHAEQHVPHPTQSQHSPDTDAPLERLSHEYFVPQQHMEPSVQDSVPSSLRQRKERMSKRQKELYVQFLEQNPFINELRRNDPTLDPYWMKLTSLLNAVPQGAVKHIAEWKQTFDNWRYRVFLYARYNSRITGEASLNPKSFKPLTNTDKRAYSIWIKNPDTAPPDLDKMRNVFVNLDETLQE